MANEATQTLASYAASLDLDAIPETTRAQCKNLLLDALACALAGHQGEETPQVAAFAATLAPGTGTSIIGGATASLSGATILNAFLITAVTMCDAHRPTLTHVTPEVVPPALAIAERDNHSGRDLLTALAAGCEVTTRIGLGLDFPRFRAKGFHGPGIIGPFGAAAAAGRLFGFDPDTMARGFALAGSQAAGTFAAWGTPTVKFHQCRGALSGLMAALLAQQHFIANPDFLTCPDGGLFSAYSDGGHPDRVTAELGTRWELRQIALRPWPAAAAIQGMITALFDLLDRNDLAPHAIRQVRVALGQRAFDMHGHYATYQGKFQAMLSAHYAAAAVLHDRDLSLRQFEPDRYESPPLVRFAAENVSVSLDTALSGPEATVELTFADGATLAAHCTHPRGAPENPLAPSQVAAKFRRYAEPRLPAARIDAVIDAVTNLETLTSVRDLMSLLRQQAA
ncbi:MAG TPA: MmgE/PrpD family protein [Rhodopila sp.]|nr:MmgE/PrpD family protein [Rhodopila sp.]